MNGPHPSALGYLWHHHRPTLIGFALILVIALAFALRLALFTIYWSDPAHRNQPIKGWMTPGYVARSYDVDPDVIRALLTPQPEVSTGTRPTLERIAEAEGIALPDLIAQIEAAINAVRAE
jgi:hypothetical protein